MGWGGVSKFLDARWRFLLLNKKEYKMMIDNVKGKK